MSGSTGSTGDSEGSGTGAVGILRDQALNELAGVQGSLMSRGVGAAFLRAAKPDPVGDMGVLNSLIAHVMLAGPLEHLLGDHLPFSVDMLDHFNHAAIGIGDGINQLKENLKEGGLVKRKRAGVQSSFFYKGGRKNQKDEKKVKSKFNKASKGGQQPGRFSMDVQRDLARMFELTDTVDKLDQRLTHERLLDDERLHAARKRELFAIARQARRERFPKGRSSI